MPFACMKKSYKFVPGLPLQNVHVKMSTIVEKLMISQILNEIYFTNPSISHLSWFVNKFHLCSTTFVCPACVFLLLFFDFYLIQINQIPFLSTALLVVLVALPVNLFPSMLVWVYTQVILSSEPLLMMLEAIAVVHFVMQTSKQLVSYIDDRPVVVKVNTTFLY